MDTQDDKIEVSKAEPVEIESYPFVKDITPGRMNRTEILAYWEKNGVFEPWPQHEEIGSGKKYADSTGYVQAMRTRTDYRGH